MEVFKMQYLKSEDLKNGMVVTLDQLENIYDKTVVLEDLHIVPDENGIPCKHKGTIAFIGSDENADKFIFDPNNKKRRLTKNIVIPMDGVDYIG